MFGYILPYKPEMKIKDYELFRAYYCGVCKSIGKRYGQLSRLTLNYDSTFLAVLLSGLADSWPKIKKETCIAHPLKKRMVVKNHEWVDYASDMNIILAYYNLKDNWMDDHSVLSGTAMLLLKKAFKKLYRKYKDQCTIIEKRLAELQKLENEQCDSMDRAAEPFAKLMEEVLSYPFGGHDKNTAQALRWIGYHMGRWIYILDAYDDIEKDIKKKSYNPLLCQFKYSDGDVKVFKDGIKDRVEFSLTYSLSQIAKTFELITVKNNRAMLDNIIYMGMLNKTEQILMTGGCKEIEKSI